MGRNHKNLTRDVVVTIPSGAIGSAGIGRDEAAGRRGAVRLLLAAQPLCDVIGNLLAQFVAELFDFGVANVAAGVAAAAAAHLTDHVVDGVEDVRVAHDTVADRFCDDILLLLHHEHSGTKGRLEVTAVQPTVDDQVDEQSAQKPHAEHRP